jgi:hypothetical protein
VIIIDADIVGLAIAKNILDKNSKIALERL